MPTAQAYNTIQQANKVLKDEAIDRQGGTAARQDIFAEQAEQVVLQTLTGAREQALLAKVQNGVPLTPQEEAYYSAKMASATLPNPPSPAPPSLAALPAPAPPPAALDLKALLVALDRTLWLRDTDKTRLSLRYSATDGFKVGETTVAIAKTPEGAYALSVGGTEMPLSVGLLVLLVGIQKAIDERLSTITKKDLEVYLAVLSAAGVAFDTAKASDKKRAITQMRQQAGLGVGEPQRKPPKSQATRVRPTGAFGDLRMDVRALGQGIVHLTDGEGTLVYHGKGSLGLIHLLTQQAHRGQAGKRFTEDDLRAYHTLAQMAKVPVKAANSRARLAEAGTKEAVFIDGDPKAMAERLDTLLGLRSAGNQSTALMNEAMVVADRLLRDRHITKKQHRAVFHALL